MARVTLLPQNSVPASGAANNASAPLEFDTNSNATAPTHRDAMLAYDPDTPQYRFWSFEVPDAYDDSSDLTVRVWWKTTVTANNVDVECRFVSQANDDSENRDWSTLNNTQFTAPGTATNVSMDTMTVTRANADTITAGERCIFVLGRDADDGTNDTCTGEFRVLKVVINFPE